MKQHDPSLSVDAPARRVVVSFTSTTDLAWLKFLLPRSFRHCAVHIHEGKLWASVEALAGYTEIAVHSGALDLPSTLREKGFTVIDARLRRDEKTRRMALPGLYSCVTEVKRILGLHRPLIITPGQLYRHLIKLDGAR